MAHRELPLRASDPAIRFGGRRPPRFRNHLTGNLVKGVDLEGTSRDGIAAFENVLDKARLPVTVRLTRGREIAAACGR